MASVPARALSSAVLAGLGIALYRLLSTRKRCAHRSSVESDHHAKWVEVTRALFNSSERPHQSDFLVAACIVYVDAEGAVRHVTGVNSEVCSITGCICAERTAALQLRLKAVRPARILAVYITATADSIITPGLLCREFLSEIAGPDTQIVMFTPDWQPLLEGSAPSGQFVVYTLGSLYPHACLYRGVHRRQLIDKAQQFAGAMDALDLIRLHDVLGQAASNGTAPSLHPARLSLSASTYQGLTQGSPGGNSPSAQAASPGGGTGSLEASVLRLYRRVVECANSPASTSSSDELYPIRYAAGALLGGGGMAVARMDICLEYGCSVDAVTKLAHTLELGASGSAGHPILLLMADQYGILHAPFAAPRAWLSEAGFGATPILLHTDAGRLAVIQAAALAPAAPAIKVGPTQ